jgi:hypothetical protein
MPRLTGKCVTTVRREMLGRGFTLVDTSRFFDDSLLFRLRRGRLTLSPTCRGWSRYPELVRYCAWLQALLGRSLPEECQSLAALEYRHEPAGSVDEQVDRLHADGSYIRSVYTLYGATTVYRDGGIERTVPRGQTLLLTAMDRARALGFPCTLHRRPGAGAERAVIVCSFEPRLPHGLVSGLVAVGSSAFP